MIYDERVFERGKNKFNEKNYQTILYFTKNKPSTIECWVDHFW